jgi:hypothetical protein
MISRDWRGKCRVGRFDSLWADDDAGRVKKHVLAMENKIIFCLFTHQTAAPSLEIIRRRRRVPAPGNVDGPGHAEPGALEDGRVQSGLVGWGCEDEAFHIAEECFVYKLYVDEAVKKNTGYGS